MISLSNVVICQNLLATWQYFNIRLHINFVPMIELNLIISPFFEFTSLFGVKSNRRQDLNHPLMFKLEYSYQKTRLIESRPTYIQILVLLREKSVAFHELVHYVITGWSEVFLTNLGVVTNNGGDSVVPIFVDAVNNYAWFDLASIKD